MQTVMYQYIKWVQEYLVGIFSCFLVDSWSSTCLTWEMPTGKASQCMETVLSIYKYPLSLSLSPPHAYAITHTHTHAQVSSSFFPNSERMHSLFSLSPTHIRTKTHTQRRWALYTRLAIGKCIYTKHTHQYMDVDLSIYEKTTIHLRSYFLALSFLRERENAFFLPLSRPRTNAPIHIHNTGGLPTHD